MNKEEILNKIKDKHPSIVIASERDSCFLKNKEKVLHAVLIVVVIFIFYKFFFSCERFTDKKKKKNEYVNHLVYEQNMYKSLSPNDRNMYLRMPENEKKRFYDTYYS